MSRWMLAVAAAGALAAPAGAGPKIDRTIGREPVYQANAPKYGLLAFGPEGRDRVWLVLDGDTLYADRNGDGDLTGADEKVAATKRPGVNSSEDGLTFEVGAVTVGGRTHKGLSVFFTPLKRYGERALGKRPDVQSALAKDPEALAVTLMVDAEVPGMKGGGIGGRVHYMAGPVDLTGVLQFASNPGEAPVIRVGGPLEVTFYAERPTLRAGRGNELVLVVGTPGVGPGTFAMLGYEETVPESAKPMIDVTYPGKPGAAPVREKYEIKERC